jgi:hypothetical protein
MTRAVVANLDGARLARMDDVRAILERMTLAINNHQIRPVSAGDGPSLRKTDEFDEVGFGSDVYCMVSSYDEHLSRVTVTELVVDKDYRHQPTRGVKWESESAKGETRLDELYSGESCTIDAMVEDIMALARRRGVRNLVHADRLPSVAAYAKQFAEHYTRLMRTAADELRGLMRASVDVAFAENVCEAAKHAAAKLHRLVADEEADAAARARTRRSWRSRSTTPTWTCYSAPTSTT